MYITCATGKCGQSSPSGLVRYGYVTYPQRMYTHALRVNTRSAPHIRCATGSCITYRRFPSSEYPSWRESSIRLQRYLSMKSLIAPTMVAEFSVVGPSRTAIGGVTREIKLLCQHLEGYKCHKIGRPRTEWAMNLSV
jgi:hypothetical protein